VSWCIVSSERFTTMSRRRNDRKRIRANARKRRQEEAKSYTSKSKQKPHRWKSLIDAAVSAHAIEVGAEAMKRTRYRMEHGEEPPGEIFVHRDLPERVACRIHQKNLAQARQYWKRKLHLAIGSISEGIQEAIREQARPEITRRIDELLGVGDG